MMCIVSMVYTYMFNVGPNFFNCPYAYMGNKINNSVTSRSIIVHKLRFDITYPTPKKYIIINDKEFEFI